jgi:hypothetical protein
MDNRRLPVINKYVGSGSLLQGISGSIVPSFTGLPFGSGSTSAPRSTANPSTGWGFGTGGFGIGGFGTGGFGIGGFGSSTSATSAPLASTSSGGSYALQVLFFFFLYGLVIFLLLILIHYTVRPVFQFIPGGTGFIPINPSVDYQIYWNTGKQPGIPAPDPAGLSVDPFNSILFSKEYTFSVDIYLTNMSQSMGLDRLIFYLATNDSFIDSFSFDKKLSLADNFLNNKQSMAAVSMVCYIADNTNDVILTYFLKTGNGSVVQRSSFPIKNAPMYTPFRLTVAYGKNTFTTYLNGLQVSQTSVVDATTFSSVDAYKFYANTSPTKRGNVQTLILWNREATYHEIIGVPVTLTSTAKFGLVYDAIADESGNFSDSC